MNKFRYSVVVLLLIVMGTFSAQSASATASWGPAVGITLPNQSGSQLKTISSPTGLLFSVWVQNGNVWFSSSADNASTWNSPISVAGNRNGPGGPDIVVSDTGVLTVSWIENRINRTSTSSNSGVSWSTPFDFPAGGGHSGKLTLAATGPSALIASWTDDSNSDWKWELWSSRSTDSGISWSSPVMISQVGFDSGDAVLTVDDQSNVVALWSGSADGNVYPLFASTSMNAGVSWSTPISVSAPGADVLEQHVARIGSQKIVTTWSSHDGTNYNVFVSSSSDTGATWTPPLHVSTPGISSARPTITTDGTNRFTIGWVTLRSPVRVQVISSNLNSSAWSSPLTISTLQGIPGDLFLTADSNSNFHALWPSHIASGDERMQSTFSSNPEVSWQAPVDLISNGGGFENISFISNPNGLITASWTNFLSSSTPLQSMTLASPPFVPVLTTTPLQPVTELAKTGEEPLFLYFALAGLLLIAVGVGIKKKVAF